MGKIAKGVNKIHFSMLYGNYCCIFIEFLLKILSAQQSESFGRSLNTRVSSFMLKNHRFRDFTARTLSWFPLTENEKGNHALRNIISRVNSRFKITGAHGVKSPEFSPCKFRSFFQCTWLCNWYFFSVILLGNCGRIGRAYKHRLRANSYS